MSRRTELVESEIRLLLRPMFDLFDFKKDNVSLDEWLAFVEMTKSRILANPRQFLGNDLPDPHSLNEIIEKIFSEFHEAEFLKA